MFAQLRRSSFNAHGMTEPLPDGAGVRLCIQQYAS